MIENIGTRLDLLIVPWVVGGGVLIMVIGIVIGLLTQWESFFFALFTALGGVSAFIIGGGWAFAAFPSDSKCWGVYSVSGIVESVSNGFIDGDGEVTYANYVVKFEGDDRPYRFDDPRITSLEGQEIEAACTVSYTHLAADKWSCDIRSADFVNQEGAVND